MTKAPAARDPELFLVDAHAHLGDDAFSDDLEEVVDRSAARRIGAVLAVSETLAEARKILSLAERFDIIKPCAGLYPTILDIDAANEMSAFIQQHQFRLAAIGEVGLDYWRVKDEPSREVQRQVLTQFVTLATELHLPLNVHSRSAGRHAIALLREQGATKVLMHAFDGKASTALAGVEAGFYFSIPPSVVRSPQKQKLVRQLPLDHLLLESDSPVLGPSKDQRNEPQNIWIACRYIASVKGLSVEEVAHITTANAAKLFSRSLDACPEYAE